MRQINVLLLGFGNVGQAFATMVLQKRAELARAGLEIVVKGISTGSHGATLESDSAASVDLAACLQLCREGGTWRLPEGSTPVETTECMLDAAASLELELDAVLEGIPANFATGEPALSYLRRSIVELKCHAITASKGPVLHGVKELEAAAEAVGKRFLFESSVMDGIPVFSFLRAMPGATVRSFEGILNSTTNIILTEMEDRQCTFDAALKKAQDEGIAERDPSGDIDGHDAATKVAVLSAVVLGADGTTAASAISTAGIGHVTLDDINAAVKRRERLKLVCSCAKADDGTVTGQVTRIVRLLDTQNTLLDTQNTYTCSLGVGSPTPWRLSFSLSLCARMYCVGRTEVFAVGRPSCLNERRDSSCEVLLR